MFTFPLIIVIVFVLSSFFYLQNVYPQIINDKVLDTQTNQTNLAEKIIEVKTGKWPIDIAINPNSNNVYVANVGSDTVSVISGDNHTKLMDIKVGDGPRPGGCRGCPPTSSPGPTSVAINPDLNIVYVDTTNVSLISGENHTKLRDIPLRLNPTSIIVNPLSNTIYADHHSYGTISVITGENYSKIVEIPTERFKNLIYNEGSNVLYISNPDSNTISVISGDNHTKLMDIPVGELGYVNQFAINPNSNTVYITNFISKTISVISGDNHTKLMDIPIGNYSTSLPHYENHGPISIAINPNTNMIYVGNNIQDPGSDTISVISGKNHTKLLDIPVGEDPGSIAINHDSNIVYVANRYSDTISLISGNNNTKLMDIPVGKLPQSITIDPKTKTVYVANSESDTVSILPGKK